MLQCLGGCHDRMVNVLSKGTSIKEMFQWELLGLGVCQAWIVSHLFFTHTIVSTYGDPYTFVLYAALFLTAIVITARSRRADEILHSSCFLTYPLVLALLGCVGSALAIMGSSLGSEAYVFVGLALVGLCGAFFEVSWGRFYTELPSSHVWFNTILSMLLAAFLSLAVSVLPSRFFFPASVLQLVFMATAMILVARRTDNAGYDLEANDFMQMARSDDKTGAALARFFAVCFIYPLIHMCAVSISYAHLDPVGVSDARTLASVSVSVVLLVAFLVVRMTDVMILFKLVLPVTALGLLVQMLLPTELSLVATFIVCGGNKLFSIMSFILLVEYLRVTRTVTVKPFALLVAAKNGGLLVGSIISALVMMLLEANGLDHTTLVSALVILLIVCFFWIFSEKVLYVPMQRTFNDNGSSGVDASRDEHMTTLMGNAASLASANGLTPRETEVLMLLARGKNRAVIMEELGISRGTAHAHITHVYQKLDVHGQQELIKLVEGVESV